MALINDPRIGTWEALPEQTVSGAARQAGAPLQHVFGGYVIALDVFMTAVGWIACHELSALIWAAHDDLRADTKRVGKPPRKIVDTADQDVTAEENKDDLSQVAGE